MLYFYDILFTNSYKINSSMIIINNNNNQLEKQVNKEYDNCKT